MLIKTTKVWVNMLIKPVLLTLMYVRAEWECDSPRHLDTVRQMITYFFAARHAICALYDDIAKDSVRALYGW